MGVPSSVIPLAITHDRRVLSLGIEAFRWMRAVSFSASLSRPKGMTAISRMRSGSEKGLKSSS